MIRPEDVTDAMELAAAHEAMELRGTKAAIAAAINASGCVLVPREPTGAMIRAASWSSPAAGWTDNQVANFYRIMLAAAPQPGKEKGDGTGQ